MGIHYENLDEVTRRFMIEESQLGGHYISPRLTEGGKKLWQSLLEEGIKNHNDDWVAQEILARGYMQPHEQYTRSGITRTRNINMPHAALQLAEGEFNRYYLRGLCVRAKADGKDFLIIYRGKKVSQPRPESEQKIGTRVPVDTLLETLRTNDFVTIEDVIGIPGGPNSGLIPPCIQVDTLIYTRHGGVPWREKFKSVLKRYKEPSSYVIKPRPSQSIARPFR